MAKETVQDYRKKLDEFTHTYMRLYSQKDFKLVVRTNNLGRLFISLGKGPVAVVAALLAPVHHILPVFPSLPLIYQLPIFALIVIGVGRAVESSGTWCQYQVKKSLYMKYKSQMELTKEQVLRLEAEEKRLMLEHTAKKK